MICSKFIWWILLSFLLVFCEYLLIMWYYSQITSVNNFWFANPLQIVHSRYLSLFLLYFFMGFVSMQHCFYYLVAWFIQQSNTAGIADFPLCYLKSILVNSVNIDTWMFWWIEFSSVITEFIHLCRKRKYARITCSDRVWVGAGGWLLSSLLN